MPNIRSSADLRNKYSEISSFCHDYAEPVFITKNGKGDLAVMSIEVYEQMMGRFDLYHQLMEGMQDVKEGNTRPFAEAMADLRTQMNFWKRFSNRSMTWLFCLPAIRWQEMRYCRPGEFASCASRIISPFI